MYLLFHRPLSTHTGVKEFEELQQKIGGVLPVLSTSALLVAWNEVCLTMITKQITIYCSLFFLSLSSSRVTLANLTLSRVCRMS